jgi:hypothetical protein
MKNRSIIFALCAVMVIVMIYIMYNQQENLHEPYSHEEIVSIINPPLDTSKGLLNGLYEKYYYAPALHDIGIILEKAMVKHMNFEQYGELEAFIFTHPHDSLLQKFERPIYIVEKGDKDLFKDAIEQGKTLIFKQSGKIAWTFCVSK